MIFIRFKNINQGFDGRKDICLDSTQGFLLIALIAVIRVFFDRIPSAVRKLSGHKKGGYIISKVKFIISLVENITFQVNFTYFFIRIFLFQNHQSYMQDEIYIAQVILINYLSSITRKTVIYLIFLTISCRINITGYIYIIAFGSTACIRPSTTTGNFEIGTKLNFVTLIFFNFIAVFQLVFYPSCKDLEIYPANLATFEKKNMNLWVPKRSF